LRRTNFSLSKPYEQTKVCPTRYIISMKLPDFETIIEQIALLFASFVWTTVVLAMLSMFWAYQDIQARWELVLNAPQALAQVAPTPIILPTTTPWPGPGPTLTPTATKPPTPTATRVIPPPNILPETLNPDDPTPVIIPASEIAVEPTQPPTLPPPTMLPSPTALPSPTPLPAPTEIVTVPTAILPPPTLTPTFTPTPTPLLSVSSILPTATPIILPTVTPKPTDIPTPPPSAAPVAATQLQTLIPSRLVIPSVGIDSKIIPVGWQAVAQNGQEYSVWQVADHAIGWHETSAGLGQVGNTVMTGHHNVQGEVFRDLVNVEVGDKLTVYSGEQLFQYEVSLKTIVKEKGEPIEVRQRNAQWIATTDDERLTLVTCWPYTNNTHRVIVVAKPSK